MRVLETEPSRHQNLYNKESAAKMDWEASAVAQRIPSLPPNRV